MRLRISEGQTQLILIQPEGARIEEKMENCKCLPLSCCLRHLKGVIKQAHHLVGVRIPDKGAISLSLSLTR